MSPSYEIAASSGTSLLLIIVGAVIVIALIAAFYYGSRRTARSAQDVKRVEPDAESGGAQRGETWQTIDDDPDQGNPHP
jgi:Flp pilus assembly protein TadB